MKETYRNIKRPIKESHKRDGHNIFAGSAEAQQMCQNRPTKETYRNKKRPTKESHKRDRHIKEICTNQKKF